MVEKPKKTLEEIIAEKEHQLRKREEREKKRIEKDKQALVVLKKKKAAEYQKKLNQEKYRRGGLIHIAGLLTINPNILLGALFGITEKIINNDEDQLAEWESVGKSYFTLKYKGNERAEVQKINEQKIKDAITNNPILEDRMVQ